MTGRLENFDLILPNPFAYEILKEEEYKDRDKSKDGYTLSYYVGIVSRIDGTHD